MQMCRWVLVVAVALGACAAEEQTRDRSEYPGALAGPTMDWAAAAGQQADEPVTSNAPEFAVTPTSEGVAGADAPVIDLEPGTEPEVIDPSRIITESLVVPAVPVDAEATLCMTRKMTNPEPLKVVQVRAYISNGSHHFMVDRSPDSVNIPVLTPCPGLAGTDATRILIAEKPETIFRTPPGVAFSLAAQQNLTFELHYINYTGAVTDIEGRIEFILAEEGEAEGLQEAGMIFTGNPAIILNPGTMTTIEFFGAPVATPEAPVHVFAMTSHMHSLGTYASIERVADAFAPPGELVHETWDWETPPMDQYDPPLTFTGSDGLRLRCNFNNTRDFPVTFGTRFQDEMCFMWLYYYPNSGAIF